MTLWPSHCWTTCSVVLIAACGVGEKQGGASFPPGFLAELKAAGLIHLHPLVEPQDLEGFGRCLVTTGEIYVDEVLLETAFLYDVRHVPDVLTKHPHVLQTEAPLSCNLLCQRRALMSLGLEMEMRREMASKGSSLWGRYVLEIYPHDVRDIGAIAAMDDALLSRLNHTFIGVGAVRKFVGFMEYMKALLPGLADIFAGYPPTPHDMKVYYAIIWSRAFNRGEYPPVLIGFQDIVNHAFLSNDSATLEMYSEDKGTLSPEMQPGLGGVFVLRASRKYNKDDQILSSYGEMGSLDLLINYGFILPPELPRRARLPTFTIKAPLWSHDDVWRKLCSKDDEHNQFWSSDLLAGIPEGVLLCARAMMYSSATVAKQAIEAGWLQQWQLRSTDWGPDRRVSLEWILNDLNAFRGTRTHCTKLAQSTQPAVIDSSQIVESDPWRAAQMRMYASAVFDELNIISQCVQEMNARIAYLEHMRDCCVELAGPAEEL